MFDKKAAPHKHEWQNQYTRDWRYLCAICGKRSCNNLVQDRQFREPLRLTSVVLIGPDAGRVIRSIIQPDGSELTIDVLPERSNGDGQR